MLICSYLSNGARRDRTADLLLAKQALSQLSYGPLEWILTGVGGGAREAIGAPQHASAAGAGNRAQSFARGGGALVG